MHWILAVVLAALTWSTCTCQGQNAAQGSIYQSDLFIKMMNDLRHAYDQKLNTLQKRIAEQEEKYNVLENSLKETRIRRQSARQVAFYAQLQNDLTGVGNYQTIVFDLVTTNLGSGYNPYNGMFTAPSAGTYVFSWTTASADYQHMQTELVLNNNVVGITWADAGDHEDYAVATNTAVVHMNAGDVVSVRSNTRHWHNLHGQRMSTFSGWLLYAD